jgi:hypothetical protein
MGLSGRVTAAVDLRTMSFAMIGFAACAFTAVLGGYDLSASPRVYPVCGLGDQEVTF